MKLDEIEFRPIVKPGGKYKYAVISGLFRIWVYDDGTYHIAAKPTWTDYKDQDEWIGLNAIEAQAIIYHLLGEQQPEEGE